VKKNDHTAPSAALVSWSSTAPPRQQFEELGMTGWARRVPD
jgi:hypothetical protein